jgi:chromosome partitioning protein
MRTIAVVNQKGGCGKTITSINLSAFLARTGRRVLLVDMDPQGHATLGLTTDAARPPRSMYDVLTREVAGAGAHLSEIVRGVFEHLALAPADIFLSAVPEKVAAVQGRENLLAHALAEVRDQYDYVVIDCPPSVGLLTFNALKACSQAIVPMDPSFFSLHGIGKQLETFDVLTRTTGHRIEARVLVTLYSGRTAFVRSVVEELHAHLRGSVFQTIVRHSVKLAEAASHGLPIIEYCKRCAGFDDYRALAAEVMELEAPMPAEERAAVRAGGEPGAEPASDAELRPAAAASAPPPNAAFVLTRIA